jgi:hypothetical protein
MRWWEENGHCWLEELRNLIIEHCDMGQEKWFDCHEDLELLQQYYDANKLLVACLNNSKVSPEIRSRIEDNLFMPLDSSPS